MAKIAVQRVKRCLERARFVVMRKPPLGEHAFGRGALEAETMGADPG